MENREAGLGPFQYLTIAVGCMIGIGWITVLGEWLRDAGATGAVLGFAAGGVVMCGVAACYAELSGMMPHSGGEVVYMDRVFGPGAAFAVGWFLMLLAVAVVSFEALSFVWIFETLFAVPRSDALYTVLGTPVTLPELVLGFSALSGMFAVNALGIGAAARVQDAITVFKVSVMLVFIGAGLLFGEPGNIWRGAAAGTQHQGTTAGVLWVIATTALWLGGFQVVCQAAGERSARTAPGMIGRITTGSVVIGTLFYIGVIIAATSVAPVSEIISAPLPAARAAESVFGAAWGARIVLLAGLCGVLGAMNGMLISGSRLLYAMAVRELVPVVFARRQAGGNPRNAVAVIAAGAIPGVLAGKSALFPVVSIGSLSTIVVYALMCATVWRLRGREPDTPRPFRVPGGRILVALIGIAISAMAFALIARPFLAGGGVPVELMLFTGWAVAGVVVWYQNRDRARRLVRH